MCQSVCQKQSRSTLNKMITFLRSTRILIFKILFNLPGYIPPFNVNVKSFNLYNNDNLKKNSEITKIIKALQKCHISATDRLVAYFGKKRQH